jgi:hypothetical protein
MRRCAFLAGECVSGSLLGAFATTTTSYRLRTPAASNDAWALCCAASPVAAAPQLPSAMGESAAAAVAADGPCSGAAVADALTSGLLEGESPTDRPP